MDTKKVEYRLNAGLLIFSATTLILVIIYLMTNTLQWSLSILYFFSIWQFDRTVVVFKKGGADGDSKTR